MIIPSGFTLQDLKPFEINKELNAIKSVVNGQIAFGDVSGKNRNMDGVMVPTLFELANTEQLVSHNLGSIPTGYLALSTSNGGVVYDGVTRTSKTGIFLRSTTANNQVLLFILR